MAATTEAVRRLATYVQAPAADAYARECADEAEDMVADRTRDAARPVPDSVRARAALEVGAELFHRRQARNGIVGMEGEFGAPMRIARDPMKAAEPILAPYLGAPIA